MAKQKKRMVKPGKFILIEGISGSGKSTLARSLVQYLKARHKRVILDSEPTQNVIGRGIRKLIDGTSFSHGEALEFQEFLNIMANASRGHEDPSAPELKAYADRFREAMRGICVKLAEGKKFTELEFQLLYIADRYLDLESTILPALERGTWVVLDRYDISTYAYGSSRGLHMEELRGYHLAVLGDYYKTPDITIFVRVPALLAAERLEKSEKIIDRFEKLESLKVIATEYKHALYLSEETSLAHVYQIDGSRPQLEVFKWALNALQDEDLLPQEKK